MGFNCGIVGLPNVGKSTLFNALTQTAAAEAQNFPFCTIEPNIGKVAVPDGRLDALAGISKSEKIIPTRLEFVDIAGLVKGASKGEGLGNQFLGNIREVDAVLHVLRCFDDDNITHVEGSTDPVRDAHVVETELMLADLENLEKRVVNLEKRIRGGDKEASLLQDLTNRTIATLSQGKPARATTIAEEEHALFRQLQLLTSKPVLYVANVSEQDAKSGNAHCEQVQAMARDNDAGCVVISARIEEEIATLDSTERMEFLNAVGLEESGLARIIRAGYELLDLQTYFTTGPKETRAWTIAHGTKAPQAAGNIHTDFERGFIRAETVSYDDFIACNGEQGAREGGKLRQEGKDYVVKDGDVMLFRFNV